MNRPYHKNWFYFYLILAITLVAINKRLGCLSNDNPETQRIINAVNRIFSSMSDLELKSMGLWKYFPIKAWRDFVESEDILVT